MTDISYNKSFRERIKVRDTEAFHRLYTDCFPMLERYAMRYVYDWAEAKDIVQEAFFSFWENAGRYDSARDPVQYLLGTVKYKCSNYLRSLRIKDSHRDKIIEALLFSAIEDHSVEPDVERRLKAVLSTISQKQMEVLKRHVISGETMPEIAAEMGISESTAKTHYRRAMDVLRRHLVMILFGF